MNQGFVGFPMPAAASPTLTKFYSTVITVASGGSSLSPIALNLPQTYSWIRLIAQLRGDNSSASDKFVIRFNNDTGANYDGGAVVTSGSFTGVAGTSTAVAGPTMPAATAPAGSYALLIFDLFGYTSSSMWKQWIGQNFYQTAATSGGTLASFFGGHWRSTTPVSYLAVSGNSSLIDVGSTLTLYGAP